MEFELTYETREGYIFCTANGPVTSDSLANMGHTIRYACETTNLYSVIIDCQAMQGALASGSLYFAIQQFIQNVGPSIHVTYINPPSQWNPTDDKFSRDVAANYGGTLMLFKSESEATT